MAAKTLGGIESKTHSPIHGREWSPLRTPWKNTRWCAPLPSQLLMSRQRERTSSPEVLAQVPAPSPEVEDLGKPVQRADVGKELQPLLRITHAASPDGRQDDVALGRAHALL